MVLDPNDLLHYSRYDKIPWAKLYGKNTVVVIPHVVVDEIDKKSYATSDTIRRRARGVFALLEQTLTEQRQGQATAGGVRIEVLLDEPQHMRLPPTTTRSWRGPASFSSPSHPFRSRS